MSRSTFSILPYINRQKVKPAICRVGMGTWGTQVSFEDKGYSDENGKALPMTLQELPTDIRGQWKTEGSLIKQTSNEESCIRLNPGEITFLCPGRSSIGPMVFSQWNAFSGDSCPST